MNVPNAQWWATSRDELSLDPALAARRPGHYAGTGSCEGAGDTPIVTSRPHGLAGAPEDDPGFEPEVERLACEVMEPYRAVHGAAA